MSAAKRARGPYAKGDAKREVILEHAIEAFGRYGYHATSMREIAAACGLSQAGLLHHFPNKEALLMALVERRDQRQARAMNSAAIAWQDEALRNQLENTAQRPLTQLWATLASEATDPDHPAHDYFVKRFEQTRRIFSQNFAAANDRTEPNAEDEIRAQLLTAVWDGLQLQWLLDPKFDMRPAFEYAVAMLSRYSQYK